MQEFADECHKMVSEMEESDFVNHITSMMKEKQEPDLALEDEVLRNWSEVTTSEYVFDRRHREVSAIWNVTNLVQLRTATT